MKANPVYACLVAMLLSYGSYAQVREVKNVDSVQLDESKDLQQQLIPLDSIIDIALKNSPSVKFQQDVVDASKYQIEYIKREWTNDVAAYANFANGNQLLVSQDNQTPTSVTSSSLSNSYRAGVQLTVPLYNFTGHKSRVNIYKAELQSSIDKRDAVKQDLVRYLIQIYYDLLYSRNLVTIRSDAKQAGINQYHVAEQEFRDGVIAASELSRLKTIEANARVDYEEAKRQFSTNYYQFLNLVGVPVEKLMQKR